MRNLKRALSLGLTAAMISGLMVMGSSAAGYADVTLRIRKPLRFCRPSSWSSTGATSILIRSHPQRNGCRYGRLMEYTWPTTGTSPSPMCRWAEPYVAACYTNGIIPATAPPFRR